MPKCDVCKNEYDKVTTLKNLTREERCYCDSCLISGIEPYEDLVNYGWISDLFCETYRKKVLIPTLQYNRKTIQQFNNEVREKRGL